MVSLGPSRDDGHRQIGDHAGFAFRHTSDRESVRSEDVDLLTESNYIAPLVNRSNFVCLYLPWVAIFEALLLVTYEILIFVIPEETSAQLGGKDPPFSFLALLHVILWLVVMACHFLLWLQHHHLQLRGYLDFCHITRKLRLIPPLVLAFGNAVLLAFFSIMDHAWNNTTFHHFYFLQIVYSLEFLIIFPTMIYYIVKAWKFKQARSSPDCYAVADDNFQMGVEGELGYSDTAWPDGVLEKQADMIRFLQKHNENLSRRLLRQARTT